MIQIQMGQVCQLVNIEIEINTDETLAQIEVSEATEAGDVLARNADGAFCECQVCQSV